MKAAVSKTVMGHWPIESSNLSLSAIEALASIFPRLPSKDLRSAARRLVPAAIVAVLMQLHGLAVASAAPAGAPSNTSSFYVFGSFVDACGLTATTECPLYVDGARETVPSTGGLTILDFGAPCFEPATLAWGTQLFNSQSCTPDSTLVVVPSCGALVEERLAQESG